MGNTYENLTREQLVEALDAASGRFEETLQSAQHILYRLNAKKGGYDYLSPYFAELTGHPLAEFKQVLIQQLPDYFHPDDRERIFGEHGELARAVNNRVGNKVFLLVEYRLRKADGTYCWLRDQNTINCSAEGQIESIVGSAYDISEQKNNEEKLRKSEEHYRALFTSMNEGFAFHEVICNDEGEAIDYRYLDINPAFERLTGLQYDTTTGKRVREVIPGIEEYWITTFGQVALTGVPHEIENYVQELDRYYRAKAYSPEDGKFAVIFEDVTEQKKLIHSLEESEERFRSIMALSPDIISIISKDGNLMYNSPAALHIHGYTEEEMSGLNTFDLIHPEDQENVGSAFHDVLNTPLKPITVQFRYRNKDGSYTWMESSASNQLSNPHINGVIAISRNIEYRKKSEEQRLHLEKQLLHAQKLESLGVLAGGIAHDFNNILTTIIGNAELALMRLNPESPVLENLHRIEQAAARAADLARQMLAYSGKGKFVIEAIDLNRMVEEMGHMLEVSISKKAILRFNLTKPLPSVDADATQIRQIIMNLVINASEAIGDRSGVIAITTGCVECNEAYLRDAWLADPLPQGLYVFMEIADTGCGMDKDTLRKLFDPFFTTKFTGRGLGMAAVLGIVRGHKGAIKVYSEPDKGSTFKVLFPACERPAEIFDGAAQIVSWRGSGLVLLVDDEETIRGISSEMLKELGFTVVTATDGRDAVAIFKSTPGISFVILDLTMPHMDGEQCFRELRQLDPHVRVIMSSGFSEHEVTQKFTGKGLAGFIQKPYKLSTLQDVIRKMEGLEK